MFPAQCIVFEGPRFFIYLALIVWETLSFFIKCYLIFNAPDTGTDFAGYSRYPANLKAGYPMGPDTGYTAFLNL